MSKWLILCCLLLRLVFPGTLGATVYYVHASLGNDNNSGTNIMTPWKTLHKITFIQPAFFQPGDQILFHRGEVWHESLRIPASGVADNPLTIGAYGTGAKPVFDGTYPDNIAWMHVSGNIYRTFLPAWETEPGVLFYKGVPKPAITTLTFRDPVPARLKSGAILIQYQVDPRVYTNLWVTSSSGNTVSGITFFEITTNATTVYVRQRNAEGVEEQWPDPLSLEGVTASTVGLTEPGHWYWNEKEKAIYLYADDVPDETVGIGSLDIGIDSRRHDYLTIQDITLQGFNSTGLVLNLTTGSTVKNMNVYGIGATGDKTGILLKNADYNHITDNRVDAVLRSGIGLYGAPPADGSTMVSHNIVSGNRVTNTGSTGISLNTDHRYDIIARNVVDNIIENNTIIDANTMSYDAAGVYTLFIGLGNIIRSNTIKNGGSSELRSAGIMIDGGSIIIDGQPNALQIYDNTIENNSLGGIVVSGEGHLIRENTLYCNGVPSWESAQMLFFAAFGANAADCRVHGNVMEADWGQKLVSVLNGMGEGSVPHDIDENIYRSNPVESFCWSRYECSQPLDFNSWKIESEQDALSTFSLGISTPPVDKPDPPEPDPDPDPDPPEEHKGQGISGVYLLLLR
jgi:hypothetical protein